MLAEADVRSYGEKGYIVIPGMVEPAELAALRAEVARIVERASGLERNDDVLAVGVLLDDFTRENGPLLLVPGSHRGPVLDHHAGGRFCGGFDPEAAGVDVGGAVPVLAPAGSISVHHARTIHGSDLNRSGRPRGLLLYEICAADAWPLAGGYAPFGDLEEFDARMICGRPTLEPRLEKVPVRMPLPKPLDPTSIYNAQKGLSRRFFDVVTRA